jgi:leucyl aminopeptidase (aminopeptidase T)
MTPTASNKRKAVEHLFRYLDARPGPLLFVYERAFDAIVAEAKDYVKRTKREVEFLCVDGIAPSILYQRLTEADKFLCAYNLTFGTSLTDQVLVMTERATTLSLKAYTLADLSDAFFDVFQACPDQISLLNEKLIRTLQNSAELEVKNRDGTSLRISLDKSFDWVNIDGFTEAQFDLTCNLPVGEVATYSPHVNGVIYFTGSLLGTIPIGRKYGPIRKPIRIEIDNNIATNIECDNKQLQHDLAFCLYLDTYTNHVNEIGIGTNDSVRGELPGLNYKYEENHYGFHLGFGASLAQQNVTRLTPHHLDLIFNSAEIIIDGRLLFDGEFRLEHFPEADTNQPLRLSKRSCCGVYSNLPAGFCT